MGGPRRWDELSAAEQLDVVNGLDHRMYSSIFEQWESARILYNNAAEQFNGGKNKRDVVIGDEDDGYTD